MSQGPGPEVAASTSSFNELWLTDQLDHPHRTKEKLSQQRRELNRLRDVLLEHFLRQESREEGCRGPTR